MLCLRCGKREQFVDNLCEECLLETVRPASIPPVIQGDVCRMCNRLRKGRSWTDPFNDPADAAVHLADNTVESSPGVSIRSIDLSVDRDDNYSFNISGNARTIYHGMVIEQELSCEVRLHPQTCPWCSRQQGNYFEAIIQLRGLEGLSVEQIESLLGKIRDETYHAHLKDPSIFISRDEKVRGGYDIYMGENSFARGMSLKLHDQYGGDQKTTSSLYGRKDGRDIYRHTYLVRLPGFLKGDYLSGDMGPYKVLKVKRKVAVLDLENGRETNIDLRTAMSMKALKPEDVEVDLIVVMDNGDEVQVLHPSSMRPVDLVKKFEIDVKETVKGIWIDDELYLA
ncbi:MAG: NMD3-related protein [Candidatus Thermoplasmatota archaeon]|nr:NMD3-related protein [Candidatus Thermoplasmatota archaeon]